MNLEKRVEVLEQELQILKNQIQASLLDIQDKVLTNAYPSLRAEEAEEPPRGPSSGSSQGRGGNVRSVGVQDNYSEYNDGGPEDYQASTIKVQRVSLNQPENHNHSSNGAPVAVNRVERTNIPTNIPPMAEPEYQPAVMAQRPPEEEEMSVAELKEWVIDIVDRVGVRRAQEMIQQKARRGYFTSETERVLLHFASLYEEDEVYEEEVARTDDYYDEEDMDDVEDMRDYEADLDTLVPSTSRVEPPASSVTVVREWAEADAKYNSNGQAKKAEEKEKDSSSNIILRIIAGVQNAGVDMGWGKKDG